MQNCGLMELYKEYVLVQQLQLRLICVGCISWYVFVKIFVVFLYVFLNFGATDALEIGMQGMHGLETNCSNGAPEAGDQFANGQIICSLILCIIFSSVFSFSSSVLPFFPFLYCNHSGEG